VGLDAALVALGRAAIYLSLILVGGAVMSEPLFGVFMLASPVRRDGIAALVAPLPLGADRRRPSTQAQA
jgi:hypothetical protein